MSGAWRRMITCTVVQEWLRNRATCPAQLPPPAATGHSTVVHVAGLSLVVSGDVVYNQTHMWMMGSTPDSRASWTRALDAVAELDADTLIAGHRNPQAPDDDARRQIAESRRYIADFEAALERSSTPAELIDRMTTAYPSLANPYTLWVAAYDLLGTRT